MADGRYILGPIFGPKIVLSLHHLWVVPDNAFFFFLGPIFGPKIVFFSPSFMDCERIRQLQRVDNNIQTLSEFDSKSYFL